MPAFVTVAMGNLLPDQLPILHMVACATSLQKARGYLAESQHFLGLTDFLVLFPEGQTQYLEVRKGGYWLLGQFQKEFSIPGGCGPGYF